LNFFNKKTGFIIASLVTSVLLVYSLFFVTVVLPTGLKSAPDLEDLYRQFEYRVDTNQYNQPGICKLANGSYFIVVFKWGGGLYYSFADDPREFPSTFQYFTSSSIGFRFIPEIVVGDDTYVYGSASGGGNIELYRCLQSVDVSVWSNWAHVCTIETNGDVSGIPIDHATFFSDTPVHGHRYWCEYLASSGVGGSGEGDDSHRYILYSDDITASNWVKGNNGNAVTIETDGSNWPQDFYYDNETDAFIVFDSESNGAASGGYAYIRYIYTYDINTTWNKTDIHLIDKNIDTVNNTDDYSVQEPAVCEYDGRLYVFYACKGPSSSFSGLGCTSFYLDGFRENGSSPPEDEEETALAFIDICGLNNSSDVSPYSGVVWGNCTIPDNSSILSIDSYQIRVANDSDFTEVFINETGLNSWFNLSSNLAYTGDLYFQYRVRVKVVTD